VHRRRIGFPLRVAKRLRSSLKPVARNLSASTDSTTGTCSRIAALVRIPFTSIILLLGLVSTASAQVYTNVAFDAGIDAMWFGNGAAVADYDMDGDLDLYLVSYQNHDPLNPRTWNRLYRNRGDGRFDDVTAEAGVRADSLPALRSKLFGNKFAAAWGDYDNDGDPDLLLTNVGPEILYRNNGDGTFTDVADLAGIQVPNAQADEAENAGATWFDHNLDGFLDLYISSWTGVNRFYENNGDGTFTDISEITQLNLDVRSWMSLPIDINRDGRPDLYLANDFGPNMLFLNRGHREFEDATEAYGLGDGGESMGLAWGDATGDGLPEMYVTNNAVGERILNSFFIGSNTLPWQETAADLRIDHTDWAWGTELFDGDNDGDLDLFVVNGAFLEPNTPNRYFRNRLVEGGSFVFEDASAASQTDGRAESHGLLVFDREDDGDLDLLVTNWGEPLYFYNNPGSGRQWVKFELEGVQTNRDGFGARLDVFTEGGHYTRENDGVDFLGQSIQPVHVGLGTHTVVDSVLVSWPGGSVERWSDLPTKQTHLLREGEGALLATSQEELPDAVLPRRSLAAFPNPARDVVWVNSEADEAGPITIEFFDMTGRRVWQGSGLRNSPIRIDLSGLPLGVYAIKETDTHSGAVTTRLIVRSR